MARENSNAWAGAAYAVALLLLILTAGCGGGEKPEPLRVFAAASMRETVVLAGAAQANTADYSLSDGASGTLARQIKDGAPADLFISASPEWIKFLKDAGKLDGQAVLIARNELVCVIQKQAKGFGSTPDELFSANGPPIAIADEKAPAGKYARQALGKLGLLEGARARLVGQDDVRGVCYAVMSGSAPVGIVYRSDVVSFEDSLRVAFAFAADTHDPIEIHGAVIKDAPRAKDARDFLAWLSGAEGRKLLVQRGFKVP